MICGQPAVYFGSLVLTQDGALKIREEHRLENAPFCAGCTCVRGWHRQFISDRPAVGGEVCQAPGFEP